MLYLLRSDGLIQLLADAVRAYFDENERCLICLDADSVEVARFPQLDITAYSTHPFPDGANELEQAAGGGEEL